MNQVRYAEHLIAEARANGELYIMRALGAMAAEHLAIALRGPIRRPGWRP